MGSTLLQTRDVCKINLIGTATLTTVYSLLFLSTNSASTAADVCWCLVGKELLFCTVMHASFKAASVDVVVADWWML